MSAVTRRRGAWKNRGWVLFFLLPSAIPLLCFTVLPVFTAGWISLHRWDLISPMEWAGLGNYGRLLTTPETGRAFLHTLLYLLGYLPLTFCCALAVALMLNRRFRARGTFRAIYFLPVITSWVVVALVWQWLLNPSNGAVNEALGFLGLPQPGWWTDPDWAMPSIILASAWKDVGFNMIILLAGLQGIPKECYEAAAIDGAGPWRRLRSITLPLLTPSIFFVVVISVINGFQVFDQMYQMTGGGPDGATSTVVLHIYDLTFRYGRAGEASALSLLLFLVILAVTAIQVRTQKRWVHYG